MLIKVINNVIHDYSVVQLKEDNRTKGFANDLTDAVLKPYNVYRVYPTTEPVVDYEHSIDSVIKKEADGLYYMVHTIRDATTEEMQASLITQLDKMKKERDVLLYACDWTQLADTELDEAEQETWRIYRQEVRDAVRVQDPFDIVFPEKPIY